MNVRLRNASLYFAVRESDGALKVGVSSDPERRMAGLTGKHTLLSVIDGRGHAQEVEMFLHGTLDEFRLEGASKAPGHTEYYVFPDPVDSVVVDLELIVGGYLAGRNMVGMHRRRAAA